MAESSEVSYWAPASLFADYMIHSVEFGLSIASEAVVLAAGGEAVQVSNSLQEFIAGYISDAVAIFGRIRSELAVESEDA